MVYLPKGSEVPTKGKGSRLQGKMQLFVDEYMIDFNQIRAVKASYKINDLNAPKQAARLMDHPLVAKAISERIQERRMKTELTAEYLVDKLVAMIEANEVENPNAALRAIELAGKSIGLYKERQEISGPDGKAIEMEQRTKENANEFASRISRLAERGGEANVVSFPKRDGTGGT